MTTQVDVLKNIKHIAYSRAKGLPGSPLNLIGFVNVAKSFLCRKTKTLWKDPIWESYTDEEILIEYFSWAFSENKDFEEEFLASIGLENLDVEEFADWAEEEIEKNAELLKQQTQKLEDEVCLDREDMIE